MKYLCFIRKEKKILENLARSISLVFVVSLVNEHREEYYPNNIGPRYFGCYKLSRKTVGLKEGRREEKSQKRERERDGGQSRALKGSCV